MNNVNFESILLKRHHYWRNLLVALFIAILVTGGIWYLQKQGDEGTPAPPTTQTEISSLCSEFPAVRGEVSCEEAVDIALEEYSGGVYMIDKTQITLPKPPGEEGSVDQNVWLIGIDLSRRAQSKFSPKADRLEITINRRLGEIIGLSPIYL